MAGPCCRMGKAVLYALKQWPRLIRYVENGRLSADNNMVENAIRPFCLGRKNWLFSGNPKGAAASATLYSIIETAKACGHEPYACLLHPFEQLPLCKKEDDYRRLLSMNIITGRAVKITPRLSPSAYLSSQPLFNTAQGNRRYPQIASNVVLGNFFQQFG